MIRLFVWIKNVYSYLKNHCQEIRKSKDKTSKVLGGFIIFYITSIVAETIAFFSSNYLSTKYPFLNTWYSFIIFLTFPLVLAIIAIIWLALLVIITLIIAYLFYLIFYPHIIAQRFRKNLEKKKKK